MKLNGLLTFGCYFFLQGTTLLESLLMVNCFVPNPTPSLHKQSANFNETTVSKVSRTGPTAQSTAVKPRNHNKNPENIPSNFYNSPLQPRERLLLRVAGIKKEVYHINSTKQIHTVIN